MVAEAVNAVLFDADGVIQLAPADFLNTLTKTLQIGLSDGKAFLDDIFAAEKLALTGNMDFEVAVGPLLKRWHVSYETLLATWHQIEVDSSVLQLIASLRRSGLYCALASNQQRVRAKHMSEVLLYNKAFDHEFYSHELGHAKPSLEYFQTILTRARLDPARTLFIDDRLENVEAARKAGLIGERFVLQEIGSGAESLKRLLQRHSVSFVTSSPSALLIV